MRQLRILLSAFIATAIAATAAIARDPAGFEKIYDAPTDVNMGGRPVIADIELWNDPDSINDGTLRIALVTDVTKFIEETERDLENWVAARTQNCGERWSAGEPYIGFPPNAMRFALYLEYEFWNCGWNGQGTPRRFARESGNIDVTIVPEIVDGRLQASLGALTLDQRSGINKFLPLEFATRRILEGELKQLNENPKFFRAPQPFHDAGFVYESIDADKDEDNVIITAIYRAQGDEDDINTLITALRADGIISER